MSGIATRPVVVALLDEAARKRYSGGVLGVRAKPEWSGPTEFEHNQVPVRVVPCVSSLAVREAILERRPDRWIVVLIDREDKELGAGITAHLAWNRLRRPDPWAAVQDSFGAGRIDHRLVESADGRKLAAGLLTATPLTGWPPSPAGLLTGEHVFGAVAAVRLRLGALGEQVDLASVLRWTVKTDAATALADLRALAGDALVDALLAWVTEHAGNSGSAIGALLRAGRAADLVPVGLVMRAVLATAPGSGPRALLGREIGGPLTDRALAAWAAEAESTTREAILSAPDVAATVLNRAEILLGVVEAVPHATESDLLRGGLTSRLAVLGDALRRCADRATVRSVASGVDGPLVDTADLPQIEAANRAVRAHALASHPDEARVPRALAAVRLTRWLARPVTVARELAALTERYRDEDSWVDRAVTEAWIGVEEETLAQGLRAVLGAVRLRRAAHDLTFGDSLAAETRVDAAAPAGTMHLEDVLPSTVLPLAKRQPVLLVVADGMSQAVANQVVDDIGRRESAWSECLPMDRARRLTALGPLPSLTKVCRASLFCGELTVGEQATERTGLELLAKSHGLTSRLFHKLSLETSAAGYAVSHDVGAALDDVTGVSLVACVLNAIDDALDRSDPGGIPWTAETVKHLRPLLDRARHAGRIVVLTADHGYVVERREGRHQPEPGLSSNRSRAAALGTSPGPAEVRVQGRRVLLHDGDAVLAVDERLRYGPLKAGYHGGAAPAEVVVPINVLTSGAAPEGWRLAPPQAPAWWRGPVLDEPALPATAVAAGVPVPPSAAEPWQRALPAGSPPTLFDVAPEEPAASTGLAALVAAVLRSPVFAEQRQRATRAAVSDDQVRRLLTELLSAPAHRLDAESAAAVLGIATVQLPGALSQLQRLLNVEQYAVLSRDPDGSTVVLNTVLLIEQFDVSS